MRRQGLIQIWTDERLLAGDRWGREIDENLANAEVMIFLVSADFLASRYCMEMELVVALERERQGSTRVVPIIVRPCDWQTSPLGGFEALPDGGKPIVSRESDSRDEAFENITKRLRVLVIKLLES